MDNTPTKMFLSQEEVELINYFRRLSGRHYQDTRKSLLTLMDKYTGFDEIGRFEIIHATISAAKEYEQKQKIKKAIEYNKRKQSHSSMQVQFGNLILFSKNNE